MSSIRYKVHAGSSGPRTAYLESGEAGGETLVLVHDGAFGASAALCWSELIPLLSERFHVLAPDLIGYGDSTKCFDFELGAYGSRLAQIAEFCADLGIRSAHFVGSSFGASLCIAAASSEGHPWPMASVVAMGGAGGLYRCEEEFADLYDISQTRDCVDRIMNYLVEDPNGFQRHSDERLANMRRAGHWECMQAARIRNPESRPRVNDLRRKLADTTTPMLFVEGQADRLLQNGWARSVSRLSSAFLAATLPGAHIPHLEHPKVVADVIVDFIHRVERASMESDAPLQGTPR